MSNHVVVHAQLLSILVLSVPAAIGLEVDEFDAVIGLGNQVDDPRDRHLFSVDL